LIVQNENFPLFWLCWVKLKELIVKAKIMMDIKTDSLIIFKSRQEKWLEKQVIGKEKNEVDNFI